MIIFSTHHVHTNIFEIVIRTHPKTISAEEFAVIDSPKIASKYNVSYTYEPDVPLPSPY